jgi:hypothetical protein
MGRGGGGGGGGGGDDGDGDDGDGGDGIFKNLNASIPDASSIVAEALRSLPRQEYVVDTTAIQTIMADQHNEFMKLQNGFLDTVRKLVKRDNEIPENTTSSQPPPPPPPAAAATVGHDTERETLNLLKGVMEEIKKIKLDKGNGSSENERRGPPPPPPPPPPATAVSVDVKMPEEYYQQQRNIDKYFASITQAMQGLAKGQLDIGSAQTKIMERMEKQNKAVEKMAAVVERMAESEATKVQNSYERESILDEVSKKLIEFAEKNKTNNDLVLRNFQQAAEIHILRSDESAKMKVETALTSMNQGVAGVLEEMAKSSRETQRLFNLELQQAYSNAFKQIKVEAPTLDIDFLKEGLSDAMTNHYEQTVTKFLAERVNHQAQYRTLVDVQAAVKTMSDNMLKNSNKLDPDSQYQQTLLLAASKAQFAETTKAVKDLTKTIEESRRDINAPMLVKHSIPVLEKEKEGLAYIAAAQAQTLAAQQAFAYDIGLMNQQFQKRVRKRYWKREIANTPENYKEPPTQPFVTEISDDWEKEEMLLLPAPEVKFSANAGVVESPPPQPSISEIEANGDMGEEKKREAPVVPIASPTPVIPKVPLNEIPMEKVRNYHKALTLIEPMLKNTNGKRIIESLRTEIEMVEDFKAEQIEPPKKRLRAEQDVTADDVEVNEPELDVEAVAIELLQNVWKGGDQFPNADDAFSNGEKNYIASFLAKVDDPLGKKNTTIAALRKAYYLQYRQRMPEPGARNEAKRRIANYLGEFSQGRRRGMDTKKRMYIAPPAPVIPNKVKK